MADDQALKQFSSDAKARATAILNMEHVGADIKTVIRDLLQLSENFQNLIQHTHGQDADSRVLKKRLVEAKAEAKALEEKREAMKAVLFQLISEIKKIGVEASQIVKRNSASESPDAVSAVRIKASSQTMAEIVISANSADAAPREPGALRKAG